MPVSSLKPCSHAGCGVLVRGSSRCDKHKNENKRTFDDNRGSSSERGYGYKWQRAREGFLRKHPLCVRCGESGYVVAAVVVDHIIPHKLEDSNKSGDVARIEKSRSLFWDRNNWQPLCKICHDKKTSIEDGGFGNRGRVKS